MNNKETVVAKKLEGEGKERLGLSSDLHTIFGTHVHIHKGLHAHVHHIYTHHTHIPHIHIYIFIGSNLVTSRIMEDFDLYIFLHCLHFWIMVSIILTAKAGSKSSPPTITYMY